MITAMRDVYGRAVRVSFHPKPFYRVRRIAAIDSEIEIDPRESYTVFSSDRVNRTMIVVKTVDIIEGDDRFEVMKTRPTITANLTKELWELIESK